MKWNCVICNSSAYQRFGGEVAEGTQFSEDENGNEITKKVKRRIGSYFRCKGCSVLFANPNQFNKNKEK